MSTIVFQRTMLQDESALKTLFSNREQCNNILSKRVKKIDLDQTWIQKIIYCVKLPFYLLLSIVLFTSSPCFKFIGNYNLSLFTEIWSKFFLMKSLHFIKSKNVLVTFANFPKPEHSDIYLQKKMSISDVCPMIRQCLIESLKQKKERLLLRINALKRSAVYSLLEQEKQLKQKLTENKNLTIGEKSILLKIIKNKKNSQFDMVSKVYNEKIKEANHHPLKLDKQNFFLYSNNGSCRGASEWFAFLYLMTLNDFIDPRSHLIAVAEEFADGVPRQALLLQALKCAKPMLNLNISKAKVFTAERISNINRFDFVQVYKNINNSKYGIYQIIIDGQHEIALIKPKNDLIFLFDINYGLIKINNENEFKDYFDCYNRKGNIKFIQFSNYYIQR